METILEQSNEDTNVQLDLLQEEEAGSMGSTSFCIYDRSEVYTVLYKVVTRRIKEKMEVKGVYK